MAQIRTLLIVSSLLLGQRAWTQDIASSVREEHRYQFTLHTAITPFQEKVLVQQITGLDPEMRVNIDHDAHLIKVLAYRPIDPQEFIELAAQNSISIGNRSRRADAASDDLINE